MRKQALASAMGLGVLGVMVMLATSACESVTVQPVPPKTQPKPVINTSVNDDDPPEKPGKPGGF